MQPQSGQRSSFQWLPNNWQIGHGDLYMTELWEGSQLSPYQWHTKILTCFQFNSSVYSDDCSYGLDLEREGQAHQKY